MRTGFSKHWLHPQSVPRGFLRLYLMTMLSMGQENGYSIMQKINERTEGAWRPGPGTIYPLLRELEDEGKIKEAGGAGRARTKAYTLTPKGKRDLEEIRRAVATVGRKESVMMRLFSDLLPGTVFAAMIVNRYREGADVFRQKVSEIPQPERNLLLKELRRLLEGHLEWIDSQLAEGGRRERAPKAAHLVTRP